LRDVLILISKLTEPNTARHNTAQELADTMGLWTMGQL
jgi:hypothetical protein